MTVTLRPRDVTALALMAACNAALELTLGNGLHLIRFPLAGAILVGLNLIPYSIGYLCVPRRGAILAMGIATAFLNLAMTGAFKLPALPAIVLEAAAIDLMISKGGLKKSVLIATGVVSNLLCMAWAMATAQVLLGQGLAEAFSRYGGSGEAGSTTVLSLVVLVSALHAAAGFLFALLAWRVLCLVDSALRSRSRD